MVKTAMEKTLKFLSKDIKEFVSKWRVYTMFMVGETQCGKDVIVTIFHFLCFLINTHFSSHSSILLLLVMSKNKEVISTFIIIMSSACLSKPLVREICFRSPSKDTQ